MEYTKNLEESDVSNQTSQEVDVSNQRNGNCGRKPKEINLEQIITIPLNRRSTIRLLMFVMMLVMRLLMLEILNNSYDLYD